MKQKNETIEEIACTAEKKGIKRFLWAIQNKISSSPYSYLAYCFIIPVALMYLVYFAIGCHPLGNGSVLVLDLNGQYVYFFEALRNAIYGEGSFFYTFFRGLGGEFMGMYTYYLASPLSYLVAIFPQSRILEALMTIILLKVGLCGFSFGFYLHKNSAHRNKVIIVAFSVMYALSAYAVVYQNNMMWMDALIWLPLLTYGLEQLIANRRYSLFVISLALTVMSNYYIGYMVCIYVALYFLYYYFSHDRQALNPRGERFHFLRALARTAVFSLLALAISAFIILAAYYSLTFGKTVFSTPDWSFSVNFPFLDLLTKFLPGTYDTVRPEGLPYVYCGLLTLILLPIYFLSRQIKKREKLASALFIAVFLFSFAIKSLDLVWHGFQAPNWLNYRYSFMLSFLILVMAYKAMGNLRHVRENTVFSICALIVLFVLVCEKQTFASYMATNESLLQLETVWLTVLVTVALLMVLCMLIRQKHPRKREGLAAILTAIVCVEVFCSSLTCVVQFDEDCSYSSYRSYHICISDIRPTVNEVLENDTGFYRMEKLVHRKVNDNMALGIRGVSNSTSTLNHETLLFLNHMGYSAHSHLSQYIGGNPVTDSLLGIKYLINEEEWRQQKQWYTHSYRDLSHYYTEISSGNGYITYENPNVLSIAYGVDSSTDQLDLASFGKNRFQRINAIVNSMLGEDTVGAVFSPVSEYETTRSAACSQQSTGTQTTYSVSASAEDKATVTYSFTVQKSGEYYFYPPHRSNKDALLSVNGIEIGPFLGNNTSYVASLGWFEAGETVNVTLTLTEDSITLYDSYQYFWYLDHEVFEESFAKLKENPQFVVTDYTEDRLTGTIETEKNDQMILTTIPYDQGWKVYLDGQEIETYKTMDALVAFDIEEPGNHTLEIKYRPTIYRVGMTVSLLGTGLFAAICTVDLLIRKRRRKKGLSPKAPVETTWCLIDFKESEEEWDTLPVEERGPSSWMELFKQMSARAKRLRKKAKRSKKQADPDENTDENTPKGEN